MGVQKRNQSEITFELLNQFHKRRKFSHVAPAQKPISLVKNVTKKDFIFRYPQLRNISHTEVNILIFGRDYRF